MFIRRETAKQETIRLSRNDAKRNRFAVEMRSSRKCEVCLLDCRHIAQIHHVIPACEGGLGIPSNLILLCPNCHAIVEKLRTSSRLNVSSWLRESMPDQRALLHSIADGTALLQDGKWICLSKGIRLW